MSTKHWKEGDSAFVVIGKNNLFPNQTVIREVELVTKTQRNIWLIRFDDIADDADIKSESCYMSERFLYESMDDALVAAVDDFVIELSNEYQEWQQEVRQDED